ncbi:hypothetical protein GOQ24_15060, partial [Myroides sp. LoEW2-1]|nr:hypothetical protein [Myroides sp. LoEW2-1]
MKKRLLSVALLMTGSFSAYSQVGVGTIKPNKSAELTVESSNRGVLIPRLGLTGYQDRTSIINFPTNGINSLLVFNTASVDASGKEKGLTPGFYYWFIDQWVRLTNEGDIPEIVVNNFQEIVNKDGDKVENIIKNIINNTEGNVVYEGDKLYYIDSDGKKVEIKDKLTTITYDKETGDYIYYNEGAVDRNGNIIGKGIRIEVKQAVINKFGDIINNKSVQNHITNFLDGTYVGGNVYYHGDKLTYITKDGETKEVSIKDVVTANESKTVIITFNKKQYYVSEEYLVESKGVVPTTVDASNLPKGIYAIDVVGGVVNNFEEIVNKGPITVDGRTFKTVNDYITYLTESKGGFTKIVYDQSTGDVIFQEWDETTNSWVNVDNSKFSTIVKANETLTTLLDKGDGTFTYTDENGKTVSFDSNNTVVEIKDGVYTFKDGKGEVITTIDTNAKAIGYDNSKSGIDAKNVQDALDKLADNLGKGAGVKLQDKGDGKVTLVADNGDELGSIDKSKLTEDALNKGLFTFTRNDGTDVLFDVNTVNVSQSKDANGNVVGYDFKDSKGNVITTVNTDAANNYYDNSKSGIDAKNVQDALDKLADNLGKGAGVKLQDKGDGKVTLVADNGDELGSIDKSKLTEDALNKGLFTFTRNDGTDVLFDVNTVNVSQSKDANGNVVGYDFKDSKGDVITTVNTDAANNYYDNSKSGIDAKNVQDALDKLADNLGKGAG